MTAGRPTDYRKEYCETIIDLMKKGASIAEVCLELDVSKDAFYKWKKRHPEFDDAVKRGVALSQGWWEKQGRVGLDGSINSTMWFMNMKNRFGKIKPDTQEEDITWRDKQEVEAKVDATFTFSNVMDEIYKGNNSNEK